MFFKELSTNKRTRKHLYPLRNESCLPKWILCVENLWGGCRLCACVLCVCVCVCVCVCLCVSACMRTHACSAHPLMSEFKFNVSEINLCPDQFQNPQCVLSVKSAFCYASCRLHSQHSALFLFSLSTVYIIFQSMFIKNKVPSFGPPVVLNGKGGGTKETHIYQITDY